MAINLDAERIAGLGYRGLTRSQADALLSEIYNAAEEIVGLKIAELMSEKQLDEFERLVDADDEAGAMKWLDRNFPDFRETVRETMETLDDVLRISAEETRQPPELPRLQSSRPEPDPPHPTAEA